MHPIDEAVSKIRHRDAGRSVDLPAANQGPPRWLVLAHFALAGLAFWLFSAAFLLGARHLIGFEFRARFALGLVHTLTLGWIASTLLGSLLQMSSVHGRAPLYRPRLAIAAWALFAPGAVSFIGLLWSGSDAYWAGAAAVFSGICCYLVVIAATMRAAQTRDITYWHFANGLGYLALLASLGLILAIDRQRAWLTRDPDALLVAHVHLALVGWVSLSIVGAAYRLVPAVSQYRATHSRWPSRVVPALVNAALLGLGADCLWGGRRLLPLWAALLGVAFALYAWQHLRGPQPAWSPSTLFGYIALAGGAVWTGLGLALAFGVLISEPETRAAYVFAGLIGWVTPNILAQVHKIFPFLAWLALSQRLPHDQLPEWSKLGSPKLAWLQGALLAAAIPAGIGGFLASSAPTLVAAGALLLAASTCYAVGVAKTLATVIGSSVAYMPGRSTSESGRILWH